MHTSTARTAPTKIGPTRAEKIARRLYPDAERVQYFNRVRSGEAIAVHVGDVIHLLAGTGTRAAAEQRPPGGELSTGIIS
jgi:hypothetical protein